MRDISYSGALVESEVVPEPGDEIALAVAGDAVIAARVARVAGSSFGVIFLGLPPVAAQALDRRLEQMAR